MSDTIQLLPTPEDIQRRRRRRRNNGGYQSEGGAAALEHTNSSEDLTTALSYLSDQGLPSERARLAASNRYRELQRSGREETEERTPLLAAGTRETAFIGSGKVPFEREGGYSGNSTTYQPSTHTNTQHDIHVHTVGGGGGGMTMRKERNRLKREK